MKIPLEQVLSRVPRGRLLVVLQRSNATIRLGAGFIYANKIGSECRYHGNFSVCGAEHTAVMDDLPG